MHDIKWSPSEKKLAREVFESALQNELAEIIVKFKSEAVAISEPDDLQGLSEQKMAIILFSAGLH